MAPITKAVSGAMHGGEGQALLPSDACDCHMHVFDARRAAVPGAMIVPPTASLGDYAQLQQRLGHRRHVLVQPSTYGTDNSLMCDALREQAGAARGVAVVDDTVGDATLTMLDDAGVVGVRFNQVQAGATTMAMLDTLGPRLHERGWHIQCHLSSTQLLASVDTLLALPTPIVLDHFARVGQSAALAAQARGAVWRLMDSGKVWLKLSAPYLSSVSGAPYFDDLSDFTRAVTRDFGDRCVWGTDWPHVTEAAKPDDEAMTRWFVSTVDDERIRRRILVDNPALLYRFA